MNKFLLTLVISVCFISGLFWQASAQDVPVLTATLNSETPVAKSISAGAQDVDVARITLTASVYDVTIKGVYLATDVSGGLSNFANIFIYEVPSSSDIILRGTYSQSTNSDFIEFSSPIIIGNSDVGNPPKTYLLRANLSSSATGNVRVGFRGLYFPGQVPTLIGLPIYGNDMTLPGTTPTPTPTPSVTPTPSPTLIPTPSSTPTPTPASIITPASLGFTSLSALNLVEGNTISAVGSADPDIYIANEYGYKRLFLNPVIFNFYGHLGGFTKVKNITVVTRGILVTSGLFRNCETNDQRVYGVEVTGEDTGILHWVNTSGTQATQDDPDFFKKVFCINTNEFNWYPKGSDYTSVNQVPVYSR